MVKIFNDEFRPPEAFKTKLKSTGFPFELEGSWWSQNSPYKIVANWPKSFAGDDADILWDVEFAKGLYLEKWTDIFLGEEFWIGTAPLKKGPLSGSSGFKSKEGAEWDIRHAQVSDQINAIFADAHGRNRWDLLEIWYPVIWDRMARAEIAYVPQAQHWLPLAWLEMPPWPGWPEMDKAREENQLLYESGSAVAWLEKIHGKRTKDGLPTPGWLGPFVQYRPYFWVVDNHTSTGVKSWLPDSAKVPGKWTSDKESTTAQLLGKKGPAIVYPLGEITESDMWKEVFFNVALTFAASVAMGAAVQGIWSSFGVPDLPVLSDAVSAGLQAEVTGGDFEDGLLESLLPEVGDLVSDLGGSDLLSTASDLVAGNLEPEDLAMSLFDSLSDGLGWLDDTFDSASSFLDDLGDASGVVDDLSSLFGGSGLGSGDGGYVGSSGYPSAPPIFDTGPDGVGGTPATPGQVAAWEGDGSMLPLLAIGAVLLLWA